MFVLLLPAFAGDLVSPPPPKAPEVDFSSVVSGADVQATGADGKLHPVRARLIADKSTVAPGETVRMGLHLTQKDGWHTYWKSPGDIGLPTDITWKTPDGVTPSPYQYPVPQRFQADDIVSYGYENQVLFFTELTVPTDAKPGQLSVGAEATWLVCKTSCIPGEAALTMPLTVSAGPGKASGFKPLFDHYAAQHPKKAGDLGLTAKVVLSHDAVLPYKPFKASIVLTGPGKITPQTKGYAYAPVTGDGWMINGLEFGHQDKALVARYDAETLLDVPPEADRIGGLFHIEIDGKPHVVEVIEPLPWKAEGSKVTPVEHPSLTTPIAGAALVAVVPKGPPKDGPPKDGPKEGEATTPAAGATSLLWTLWLAFAGGLLLNIMPCVLPVLTLKLYGLIEQTEISRGEQRAAGLAYTAGILMSFLGLAAAVVVLRVSVGMDVDWGFQFQYPPYVAALAAIVFAFGLSLFGVFEIPAFGVGTASAAGAKEGPVGYFFTGVFATLLATPCSAPFLGTAVAVALSATTIELFGIFGLIGLGLAAPFLLIAFVPALYKMLPKPGAWMDTFKQLLGFTLIATTVWLTGVLASQIGADRVIGFLTFLAFVAGGCWTFGHFGGAMATGRQQAVSLFSGLMITAVGGAMTLDLAFADEPVADNGEVTEAADLDFGAKIPWQRFTAERVAELEGTPVFVDFTADWCLTCKLNEKGVLETKAVRDAMKEHGVVPLKADWTRRDATITEWLHRYGKAGVPFYLMLPANGDPVPLGEVITQSSVIEAMKDAG